MLPVCYQLRDESLLSLRKTSTLAVGINCLSVIAGTVVGTWIAIPPTQYKQEISSIEPILIGISIGELVGLVLALLLIWIRGEYERSV